MKDVFDSQEFKNRDADSYNSLTAQFDYFTERFTASFAERIVNLSEMDPRDKILDVGTGTGIVAFNAAQRISRIGEVYGIDLSEEMLKRAQEKIHQIKPAAGKIIFRRMDAEKLDFDDHKFDVVVSLFALLHFPNPLTALREIFRVLRPGGKLILAVGSGAPLFSPASWLHILKKSLDIWHRLQGKLLVAPDSLNEFINKNIPKSIESEESDLAVHRQSRIPNVNLLVKQAGFEMQQKIWQGEENLIQAPEDFWELQRTFSSTARKRLSSVAPDKFNGLRNAFLNDCRTVQSRGGRLIYPVGVYFIVARRATLK